MQAFTFHVPTEIVFGAGTEEKCADLVKKYKGTRVLLVYGEGSVVKSGLLDKITGQLDASGIAYLKHGGATPNPHLSFARAGVKAALEFGADLVLAIGGGSAIDAAKAIAHGTKNPDTDIWQYWLGKATVEDSLPIGVILTISAAGSETSNSAVLTDTDNDDKRGINTDFNRPRFAIMNPELCYSLPKYQIACGIADIMMHTMERYFTAECNKGIECELTDEIAEGLLRVVIKNGLLVLKDPTNYHAQAELMWCGSVSHTSMTGLGRTMDFSVHRLCHQLSGRFNTTHGASLAATWASWAKYTLPVNPARFARYADKIWGAKTAEEGINKTVEYFKSIGMPTTFTELGIGILSDDLLKEMANSCGSGGRAVGTFKPLDVNDIYEIYKLANV